MQHYKNLAHKSALEHFQRAAVLGFFTHNQKDHKYRLLYNLAAAYFAMKETNVALYWFLEAQKLKDTDNVKRFIEICQRKEDA